MESKILNALDWDLNVISPISFLERYQRIFDVDRESTDEHAKLISDLARKICRHTVMDASLLKYKPS